MLFASKTDSESIFELVPRSIDVDFYLKKVARYLFDGIEVRTGLKGELKVAENSWEVPNFWADDDDQMQFKVW